MIATVGRKSLHVVRKQPPIAPAMPLFRQPEELEGPWSGSGAAFLVQKSLPACTVGWQIVHIYMVSH